MIYQNRWDLIDVNSKLDKEDFIFLFSHLSLLPAEEKEIREEYWQIYLKFTEFCEPQTAWLATRNIFVFKNPQIGDRIQNLNNLTDEK